MKDEVRIAAAERQLDRVLEFLPRAETKVSVLVAVNTAMLGALAINARTDDFSVAHLGALYLAVLGLLGISWWKLYSASHPKLDGGHGSLIYFGAIAKRTEADYLAAAKQCTEEEYIEDLLKQIWVVSTFVKEKYHNVRMAFIMTACAVPFWVLAVMFAATEHGGFAK